MVAWARKNNEKVQYVDLGRMKYWVGEVNVHGFVELRFMVLGPQKGDMPRHLVAWGVVQRGKLEVKSGILGRDVRAAILADVCSNRYYHVAKKGRPRKM